MFYNETPTASGNVLSFNVNPQPGDVIQFVSPVTNTATQVYTVTFSTGVSFPLSYGGEEIVQAYLLYNGQTYLAVFTGNSLEITAQQAADAQGDTVNTAPYVINNYLNPAYSGLLATQMQNLEKVVEDSSQSNTFAAPVTMTSGLSVTGNVALTDGEFEGTATNSLALGGVAADGWAPLGSPALTGTPTAPELTSTSASDQIATMGSLNTGFIAPTLLSPTASETLPAGNFVIVQPNITAASTVTLPASAVQGAEYVIFGGASTVTVATSGSAALIFPDDSQENAYTLPAGAYSAGVRCVWDTANWRTVTFGATVVAPAVAANDAVQLGQIQNGTLPLNAQSLILQSTPIFPSVNDEAVTAYGASTYAGNFSTSSYGGAVTGTSTNLPTTFLGGVFQFATNTVDAILPDAPQQTNAVIWFISQSANANSTISCPGSGVFQNVAGNPQSLQAPQAIGEFLGVFPNGEQNWQVIFASTSYMQRLTTGSTTSTQLAYLEKFQPLPLGQVPLTASLTQQTTGGYFSSGGQVYEVLTYSATYAASSDTYEYVNSERGTTSITVDTGADAPATPSGYVPFQKVSTTYLEAPEAPVASATTGGSLTSGSYTYQTVMVNASGNSLPSSGTSVTVAASGAVDLAWRVVPYATEVQLYRDGNLLYTATTGTASGQSYTDTGTATSSTALPTENTSNFVYKSTPLYDVVNELDGKVIHLARFAPYQFQDVTALLLGLMEYGRSIYQGASYNDGINGVRIIVPDGFFSIGQPVTVLEGITLDCDGYLVNKCGDIFSPCLSFGVGAFSNELQVEGNGNSGVFIGESTTQVSTHFGNVRIQGCGLTYNSVMGMGQTALLMSGYNLTIGSLQIYQGNVGLSMYQASDVRIGRVIIIRSSTGLSMSACEQVGINYIDIDTPGYQAASIDSSQDIFMRGVLWINEQNYTGSANANTFLQIGKYTSSSNPNSALNLQLNLLNCGTEPVYVANTTESIINVIVGKGGQTAYPPQSVITYGTDIDPSFLLTGTASIPSSGNWNNGTTVAGGVDLRVNGSLVTY